jgi:hypothetical protein
MNGEAIVLFGVLKKALADEEPSAPPHKRYSFKTALAI